jgi:hypothetical protein
MRMAGAERVEQAWRSHGFCVTSKKENRSRMVTFIIFYKLSQLIVNTVFEIIGGIFRIAWLLMVLLCRMVGAVVSSVH